LPFGAYAADVKQALLPAFGACDQGTENKKQKQNIGLVFSKKKHRTRAGRYCGCYVHKARCALYLLKLCSV
jgi:hypothetical protein